MCVPLLSILGYKNLRFWNTSHSLLDDFHSTHKERQYCNARLQPLSYCGSVKATPHTLV